MPRLKRNEIDGEKIVEKIDRPIPLERFQLIQRYYFIRGMFKQFDFFSLIFLCALRKSEAIQMRGEDFDLKKKIIHIRNIKGKRLDYIPMLQDIEDHLQYMELPEGQLFDYQSKDSPKSTWKTVNNFYGFHYSIHSLRKARATYLANLGQEPLFVQRFMRHKDFRTTKKSYIEVDIEKARRSMNEKLRESNV